MQDDRIFEVDSISAVEALPVIAAPAGILGTRSAESPLAPDPLSLADSRPFRIDLGHGPALPADELAAEQGKRRG
jgi:hypothetical protein